MKAQAETAAILGLDALPKSMLEKVLEQGYMPFLSSIYKNNRVQAKDMPCIPPVTITSWPSIMSGVNPGKHGVFSFYRYKLVDGNKEKIELYSTFWLEHPRIHEMLSFWNPKMKSFMMNPIPERPLIPVKGSILVSNMFFGLRLNSVPRELPQPLRSILEPGQEIIREYELTEDCTIFEKFEKVMENVILPLAEELSKGDYKLVWLNLDFPDHPLHVCEDVVVNGDYSVMAKSFRLVDKLFRILFDSFDLKIAVSDHGFGRYDKVLSINDILVNNGLAIESKKPVKDFVEIFKDVKMKVNPKLADIVNKLHAKKIAKIILKKLTGKEPIRFPYKRTVDPFRSKAYYILRSYGIFFNDPGVRGKVIDVLSSYNDLITVYKAEEVYHGPYVKNGPGLVVIPQDNVNLGTIQLEGSILIEKTGGDHWKNGLLLAGDAPFTLPDNPPNHIVTPLVLCSMGAPISHVTDTPELLSKAGLECQKKNYIGKWRITKKLASMKLNKKT